MSNLEFGTPEPFQIQKRKDKIRSRILSTKKSDLRLIPWNRNLGLLNARALYSYNCDITVSKEQFPPTFYLKLSASLSCICGSGFVLTERLHEPIGGNFSFLLNQHFYFSLTLITQALCLSFHNPKVWKPYLHYALSAVLQKYRFKALVFPLLHVSNNVWIRTATGALLCLKFSLLKKICVPSRADKLKEKKIMIIKKKGWSSQVLGGHNQKK